MKLFLQKHHRLVFYSSWIILGLLQSALTELQDDEAYYWVYSKYLDWGYFDHPPMIGLLVKMGYSIFPNELGVRLLPLLLNVLSLLIIENLINRKNTLLFYIIVLSIAVLQLIGFAAVPDIPLIFFTALFFWCYKRFIATQSFASSVLLGVSIALLFYSKYHAVLIVVFTLLSNLKLLKRYQTYVAGFIGLLLFAPHLLWQYDHNWVSFRYHLFESNVNPYKFSFTLDYIVGQLLLPGPLAGFILVPAAFLYKPKNETEKALKYTLAGIYVFFLLSTFRGRVEGNWTSPALVALMVLSHQFLNDGASAFAKRGLKNLYRLLPFTLVLVLLARIVMVIDILPVKLVQMRYHAWKDWPAQLKEITGGIPIVFSNSYQRASKYWFYTGQMTYSQNWYRERGNNYNFWPVEDSMIGKPSYTFDIFLLYRFPDSIKTTIGWIGYRYDSLTASFAKIKIRTTPSTITLRENEELVLTCEAIIPDHYASFIRSHPYLSDTTRIGIFKEQGTWINDISPGIRLKDMEARRIFNVRSPLSLPKGKYYLRFAINSGHGNPTHNSDKIGLEVR